MLKDPTAPRERLAPWLRKRLPQGDATKEVRDLVEDLDLHTVCQSARCPNLNECWSKKAATFMLMGEACTRTCTFCDVKWTKTPPPLDATEPQRLADAIAELKLRFAVVTSVNRDDLADGGAPHFAATIRAIRARSPGTLVEVLTPDFRGNREAIDVVVRAHPDVYNHNLETIPRLYPTVRPQAKYQRSLDLLKQVKDSDPTILTKSGVMVGLGETDAEIRTLMDDLVRHRVDIFTVGQYLRPSLEHHDIIRFVTPEQFEIYKQWGAEAGFKYVASGPYVRSSYFAEEVMAGAVSLPQG